MDDAAIPADLLPRGLDAVRALLAKGVTMPNPLTIDIAPEVDIDRISGRGVVIHPGCRIRGAHTVISAGVKLGAEGPVTIDDCRLGQGVELKGGYAAQATFLAGANLGLGHHVRVGTLMEEESSGAHCVGFKQTILLPFATTGSLINFCDALLAGGTSRKDHSEIGSSYIHFNFTPSGDKTTPSLFGDVPRGVMLRERPIFLGGQGGSVGPVAVSYGAVVGAGSVLRRDIDEQDQLVVEAPRSVRRGYAVGDYRDLERIVARNVGYLAQLVALQEWYVQVRRPFFAAQELGLLVHEGALDMLRLARAERIKRLTDLAGKVDPAGDPQRQATVDRIPALAQRFAGDLVSVGAPAPAALVEHLSAAATGSESGTAYLDAIRRLPDTLVSEGIGWLQGVVDRVSV